MNYYSSLRSAILGLTLSAICLSASSQEQEALSFSSFEVDYISGERLGSVDLTSHENAEVFKEGFAAAMGRLPNFAGKYYLYITGCGTMCQALVALDVETGQMVDMISASFGACFQEDSSLLVTNPDLDEIYEGELPDWAISSYFQITDQGFVLLYETQKSFPGKCESGQ